MIVAIDGPAGAGKSTVARRVAARIGAGYLNTGAMYRAVALLAARAGVDAADGPALADLARSHAIDLEPVPGGERVLVDGVDVSEAIRGSAVTAIVSQVAAHGEVRRDIVAAQRRIIQQGDWVADGRDIGTVVAPDAELKVFLTADAPVRAARRHAELVDGGEDVALGEVLQDIVARDALDRGRAESPLRVADGAVTVDTTQLEVDQVVEVLARLVAEAREAVR